jgi:hypothetical protein
MEIAVRAQRVTERLRGGRLNTVTVTELLELLDEVVPAL